MRPPLDPIALGHAIRTHTATADAHAATDTWGAMTLEMYYRGIVDGLTMVRDGSFTDFASPTIESLDAAYHLALSIRADLRNAAVVPSPVFTTNLDSLVNILTNVLNKPNANVERPETR